MARRKCAPTLSHRAKAAAKTMVTAAAKYALNLLLFILFKSIFF